MPVDAELLKSLIERELAHVSDERVLAHIRSLLVEPKCVHLDWDYGQPGERYPCWEVLNAHIVYCESGFGPRCPWGLVLLGGEELPSMGMDSGWFPTFMEAYFDSFPVTDLPIWRVFRTTGSKAREPVTEEDSWDATWKRVYELRESDPASRYDCDHSISYEGKRS
jgi:hypothetical protein